MIRHFITARSTCGRLAVWWVEGVVSGEGGEDG